MNSNFEWQKQQTNERVQARLQEAELHRSLKAVGGQTSSSIIGKMVRLPLRGMRSLMGRLGQRAPHRPGTGDEGEGTMISHR